MSVEPSRRVPRIFNSKPFMQWDGMSRRQFGQVPHQGNEMTTWSPGANFVTLLPTASTTPAPSWPYTAGLGGFGITDTTVQVGLAQAAAHDPDKGLAGPRTRRCRCLRADLAGSWSAR